jgi:predicted DNA-binding protein YlxM (UPF0122 family)
MSISIFDRSLNWIDEGREGRNIGLSMGFNRLNNYVPNLQRGTYYLIGGETGSGKTAFTDNCFLFNPYDYTKKLSVYKMKVLYFSLEISPVIKIIKGMARKVYMDYNIRTDVNKILSRGPNKISQEIYDAVKKTREYFNEFENCVSIYENARTPSEIYRVIRKYANENGKFFTDRNGELVYKPNNLYEHVVIIVDHIGLLSGGNKKEAIDDLSFKLIWFRNICSYIPVVVSQFNRTISSTDRFKLEKVEPQLSDFKESANTQEDANVVFGLFSPNRYKMTNYYDYRIDLLGNSFRALHLLKNRDGDADVSIGLRFRGDIGHFTELPPAKLMTEEKYDEIRINEGEERSK